MLLFLKITAVLWFGCGFISFLRGVQYGMIGSLMWIPLGPIGLILQFGNVE